ncbi:type II secretion system protein GspJ [bacterium endosymbiont of Escarpia laminata]|nr:MAG: type II secretion system protein GspJ [bacterium endosymbiont of Escarpia laminata]
MNAATQADLKQSGFTLLELLIAISIFSIISLIAYRGLKVVLDTEAQVEAHIDRLSGLQIALTLMRRDIEQARVRPIRDEYGDPLPAMQAGGDGGTALVFTRGGRPNPLNLQRSNLQRIAYLLEDKKLFRLTWLTLDRAHGTEPRRTKVLDGISNIEVRFFDHKMKAHPSWPVSGELEEKTNAPLPLAIEITLELEDWGKIQRLFRVADIDPSLDSNPQ